MCHHNHMHHMHTTAQHQVRDNTHDTHVCGLFLCCVYLYGHVSLHVHVCTQQLVYSRTDGIRTRACVTCHVSYSRITGSGTHTPNPHGATWSHATSPYLQQRTLETHASDAYVTPTRLIPTMYIPRRTRMEMGETRVSRRVWRGMRCARMALYAWLSARHTYECSTTIHPPARCSHTSCSCPFPSLLMSSPHACCV